MITDRKLHQKISKKYIMGEETVVTTGGLFVSGEDPTIVFKTDEGFAASFIRFHNSNFDFLLETPYYTINEKNVDKIRLLLPMDKQHDKYKPVYTENAIFLIEELKNAVFFIYKHRKSLHSNTNKSLDVYIYSAGLLKYTIEDITGEIVDRQGVSLERIHFLRGNNLTENEYPRNWILLSGKELSENDLNLPFLQWESLFGYHKNSYYQLSRMYDQNNILAIDDIKLRWDSKELVNWKCIFGHKWKKPIYDYTHPTWPKQFCPLCQTKIKGLGFFDNDEIIKRDIGKIMYVMDYYKIYDLDDLLNIIDLDLINLESIILHSDHDNPWINKLELPNTVDFYFAYPDGKRGDISRVIANNGILTEMEYNEYKCTISTEYYKEIEVLASYHCNARFTERNTTGITSSVFDN